MDLARLQVSFLRFLLYRVWDPHITAAFDLFPRDLALALAAAAVHPRQRRRQARHAAAA